MTVAFAALKASPEKTWKPYVAGCRTGRNLEAALEQVTALKMHLKDTKRGLEKLARKAAHTQTDV